MSSKNEIICRICLKVAKNEFLEIDELVEQILGVLLLKLDLDITRDPIICEDCMEVAKKCLDFKSTCADTEDIIVLFSADRGTTRYNIRDIYEEREQVRTVRDEHFEICRFCLTRLERNNFVSLESLMNETMVEKLLEYMPETDLNVIENPIICTICRENLDSYFKFVTNCLETEGKIKAYLKKKGTHSTGEVSLANVLHFLFGYILEDSDKYYRIHEIKEDPNTFEDTDLVHQKPYSELMKLEEGLDIKEEGINFTANRYGEIKIYKCSICTFETKFKSSLKRHVLNHTDISELQMYKCAICAYKSKTKLNLKQHMIVHKDISEIKMYKCTLCLFGTKYKYHLKRHMLIHTDISQIEMYKCSMCTFETKHKRSLKVHVSIHSDIPQTRTFKCSLCSFETKHKFSLTGHMLTHKDISEIEMYNCALCAYESKTKAYLKRHMSVHKDISEIKTYKCSLCTFETKHKNSLNQHVLIHMDISKIEMYKCALCSYETKRKNSLRRHMSNHKNT